MYFNKLAGALLVALLTTALPARAGWYIGADYTGLGAEVQWDNETPLFSPLNSVRLRAGYSWGMFGLEVDYLTSSDKTVDIQGGNYNFELENAVGAYLHIQQKFIYGRLGATWLNTKFTDVDGNIIPAGSYDTYTTFAPTIAIGLQYEFIKNLWVNLDYTWMEGKVQYPSFTATGSGTKDISVTTQGPGIGLTFTF